MQAGNLASVATATGSPALTTAQFALRMSVVASSGYRSPGEPTRHDPYSPDSAAGTGSDQARLAVDPAILDIRKSAWSVNASPPATRLVSPVQPVRG